jgi:hypothetical protein
MSQFAHIMLRQYRMDGEMRQAGMDCLRVRHAGGAAGAHDTGRKAPCQEQGQKGGATEHGGNYKYLEMSGVGRWWWVVTG